MKLSQFRRIIKEEVRKVLGEGDTEYALSNQQVLEKSPKTKKSILDIYNMLSEIDDIDFIQEIGVIISRNDWNNRVNFANKQRIYRQIQKIRDDQGVVRDLETKLLSL